METYKPIKLPGETWEHSSGVENWASTHVGLEFHPRPRREVLIIRKPWVIAGRGKMKG